MKPAYLMPIGLLVASVLAANAQRSYSTRRINDITARPESLLPVQAIPLDRVAAAADTAHVLSTTDDLSGILLRTESGPPLYVLQAQLGLSEEGFLGLAAYTAITSGDTVATYESFGSYPQVFTTFSEIDGFWVLLGIGPSRVKLWVDEFSFSADADGYLNIDIKKGYTEDGRTLMATGGDDCDWHTYSICRMPYSGCAQCGTPLDGCPCEIGTTPCQNGFITLCDGDCTEPYECDSMVVPSPIGPVVVCGCM